MIVSPASRTIFWSPPIAINAPPGNTVASFIRNDELPPDLFNLAETVMADALVLASEKPIQVAVVPLLTVGVTVDGLPTSPRFGVTYDLNAISYPSAIAIAIAWLSTSAWLYTPRFVRDVLASAKSPRLLDFSILSVFKLEKLSSTSVLVRAEPLVLRSVMVDMPHSY